jgi:hypothetical protein
MLHCIRVPRLRLCHQKKISALIVPPCSLLFVLPNILSHFSLPLLDCRKKNIYIFAYTIIHVKTVSTVHWKLWCTFSKLISICMKYTKRHGSTHSNNVCTRLLPLLETFSNLLCFRISIYFIIRKYGKTGINELCMKYAN